MPVRNPVFIPPVGLLHQMLDAIQAQLVNVAEIVRFLTRLAPDEKYDSAIYLEVAPSEVVAEGVSPTIQSSFKSARVRIVGIIKDQDARIGADFAENIIITLLSSASFNAFNSAFGSNQGFSIERIGHVSVECGDNRSPWSQVDMVLEIVMHLTDIS